MPVLVPPVDAPIVRPFEYRGSPFAAGLHRGVDFGAAAGTAVRAPCDGRVTHAGATPEGDGVTLECGGRRVTLLPLMRIAVEEGDVAGRGEPLGHTDTARLHLGVRRAHDHFGYVDPERLMGTPPPPLGPAPPPSRRARPNRPTTPPHQPIRHAVPTRATEPSRPPAPWPAWLGASLVLAGAAGTAHRRRRRTRLEHTPAAAKAAAR